MRKVAVALLLSLGLCAQADTPSALWIARPEARPWLPALQAAAERTSLPVAVVAELIGQESGFRTVKNAHSSAYGFGQQIAGNGTMLKYNLHPMRPAESIMGAALELRERLDKTGSLPAALHSYGTTTGMSAARRRTIEAQFALASAYVPPQQQSPKLVLASDSVTHVAIATR